MSNLLNVNNYHYRRGGADAVYLDHAALFERLGWSCAFFSMKHERNIPSEWSRFFIEGLEFGGDYSAVQKVSMAGKVIYSFEARNRLARLLDEFRPDVAHLHNIYHHISPSVLQLLHARKVPVVLTTHDLKIACPAYKMLNATGVCERCRDGSVFNVVRHRCVRDSLGASLVVGIESALHDRLLHSYRRYVTRVVAPSVFYRDTFVRWGWPAERFAVVPNFVDASAFAPVFAPGSHFLYFGRLSTEKGVATLIRAAAQSGVQVKVAGTGPLEANLKALASASGARVEFVGFRSGADLHQLIASARAVVLPSEWYENAPMSVLEAYAFGKPVIGARIGGIPELVREGATGACFTSGDVSDCARVLSEFQGMADEQIAAMGRQARAWVESDFSPERYTRAMQAVYESVGVQSATPSVAQVS